MCCNNTPNSNNTPPKLDNTSESRYNTLKMCCKSDRTRLRVKRTRQRVVLRDDDVTIPYMVNRGLHSKHHATFLTVRSPAAVSRSEPWGEGFYMSSKQFFFKKRTVKYNIYNEIVLLPLGGGIFYYNCTKQSWLKILDKWVSCYQTVRLLFCFNTKNQKPRDIVLKKLLFFSSYVQLSKTQCNKSISDWPVKCGNI